MKLGELLELMRRHEELTKEKEDAEYSLQQISPRKQPEKYDEACAALNAARNELYLLEDTEIGNVET